MRTMRGFGLVVVIAIAFAIPSPAAAQTPKLSEIIPTLLGPRLTIAPGPPGNQASDFVPDNFTQNVEFAARSLNQNILDQLPTFPVGSSSGGFLYTFDPGLGTFLRSTRSFGPSFAERAFTSGRRTFAFGTTFQRVEFDRINGFALDGGDIRFYLRHKGNSGFGDTPPTSPEGSDVLEATLRFAVRSETVATTFTYGVAERLDIGATIPFVSATLDASVDERILRLGTASNPTLHSFDGRGSDTATVAAGGTASGIGDIGVRAKYNLVRRQSVGVSGGLDLRFPTGDSENLLGTGTILGRAYGIVSGGTRDFSPHVNAGFTFASGQIRQSTAIQEPGDEFNVTAGLDWAVLPRVTVNFDALMRNFDGGRGDDYVLTPRQIPYITTVGGPVQRLNVEEFQGSLSSDDLLLVQGVAGAKFNPYRTALVVVNVLFPMTNVGLRNKPALNIGFEYTF